MSEKTEYIWQKDIWGRWTLIPKPKSGIGILILIVFAILLLCFVIITLSFWFSLLGFAMNRAKRYYAAIASYIGIFYFFIDLKNKWVTGFLFLGYYDNGVFNEGIIGQEYIIYIYIINGIGALIGLHFLYDSYLLNKQFVEKVRESKDESGNNEIAMSQATSATQPQPISSNRGFERYTLEQEGKSNTNRNLLFSLSVALLVIVASIFLLSYFNSPSKNSVKPDSTSLKDTSVNISPTTVRSSENKDAINSDETNVTINASSNTVSTDNAVDNQYNPTTTENIQIGKQIWMVKNFDVDRFRNGDPIPEAKSREEWLKAANDGTPSWCYYEFNSQSKVKGARLYNMFVITDARGLAPDGWRIPDDKDFRELMTFSKTNDRFSHEFGRPLKSKEWPCYNGEPKAGRNSSGFSALPTGYFSYGIFSGENFFDAAWWSSNLYVFTVFWGSNPTLSLKGNWLSDGFALRLIKTTSGSLVSLNEPSNNSSKQVDANPEFPGGNAALMNFLMQNIRYPQLDRDNGIQGEVIVTFDVNGDGTISNPSINKGVSQGLDAEAIRVVKLLPKFKPATTAKGVRYTSQFVLPVKFRLQ